LASLPALPTRHGGASSSGRDAAGVVPLPEAEKRFRRAYLVDLLANVTTRAEASKHAGVPYRTMSMMITRLGIRPVGNGHGIQ
jgi:hypothetical protein